MRRALAVAMVSLSILLASSCTAPEAMRWLAHRGDHQAQVDHHAHNAGQPVDFARYQALADWWNLALYLRAVMTPEAHVRAAAREFGIPEEAFVRVIRCESGMNPWAVNRSSGALGLGQHLPRYWPARAAALGYPPSAWSDARANARVSAWLWATDGPGHWVCR